LNPTGTTFETPEPDLSELMSDIGKGLVQLPDFQRDWIWNDEHIRSLIASVSLSYPIGAIMLLETGGDSARFLPRLVAGVEVTPQPTPEKLILDGQQRLTSLFFALYSGKPVPTRNEKGQAVERLYYVRMADCLDPEADREDAVISVPADKTVTSDFGRTVELDVSTREKEYEQGLFPLAIALDQAQLMEWKMGFLTHFQYAPEKSQFLMRFESETLQRFLQYRVPVIELLKQTPKEAVCQVFEKVNTGGVTLSVFELVTATYAAENYRLRQDWDERGERLSQFAVLADLEATGFLTSVTLLARYESNRTHGTPVSCKKRDVLRLTLDDYRGYADRIEQGLRDSAVFLAHRKVFDSRILPYQTQLVPLAAICAALGDDFHKDPIKQKIAQWYWCGVFGELYGGATETRFALDLPETVEWVNGGSQPKTVTDAAFSPTRLLSMRTRQSAAYKGLMALLMQSGSRDFLSGDTIEVATYFDLNIDIHHVFPREHCKKRGLPEDKWNSAVNKTPISSKTNRFIGGSAPSEYLLSLQTKHEISRDRIREVLDTHGIDIRLLESDHFDGFLRARAASLLDLIQDAMGKTVGGRDSDEVRVAFGDVLPGVGNPTIAE